MYRTDNPAADAESWEREKEKMAESLPKCDYCGSPIDDHYYEIDGEIVCESCLEKNFYKSVEW